MHYDCTYTHTHTNICHNLLHLFAIELPCVQLVDVANYLVSLHTSYTLSTALVLHCFLSFIHFHFALFIRFFRHKKCSYNFILLKA